MNEDELVLNTHALMQEVLTRLGCPLMEGFIKLDPETLKPLRFIGNKGQSHVEK